MENNNVSENWDTDALDYEIDGHYDEDPFDKALYAQPKSSYWVTVRSVLLSLLQTNLVWYIAGLIDAVILLKLFGCLK